MPMKKQSSSYWQFYANPRIKVEKISNIKYADHIVFQRALYEHHGIVVDVDEDKGTFDVIEYDGNKPKSMAQVDCITHVFSDDEHKSLMYIVQHKKGECLPDEKVVENAKTWLNMKDYNFILQNCECMPLACKLGKSKTEQVSNFVKGVVKEVGPPASKGAAVGAVKLATFVSAKALLTGATKLGTGISKVGAPPVLVGWVVEVGLAAKDIHTVIKQNKDLKINDRVRDAEIGVRVTTAAGDISGGIVGLILGGLVAGPLGAALGGVVGGFGGRLLGWGASKGVVKAIEKSTDHIDDREEDNFSIQLFYTGWPLIVLTAPSGDTIAFLVTVFEV